MSESPVAWLAVLAAGVRKLAAGWHLAPLLFCLLWAPAAARALECPPAQGALAPRVPTLERASNPNPSPLDIELPLPDGKSKMVFRHVCVPASGYLGVAHLELGCNDCDRANMGFMESRRREAISGTFTLADLPEDWRKKLGECAKKGDGRCPDPSDRTAKGFYYFVGKYEITRYQWKVLQHAFGQGPAPGANMDADDARPMTDISWHQATDLAAKYTEWLIKNAPNALPRFSGGRVAYLRLPTEAEWEYAARGGHGVNELQMNQEDIFPLQDKPLADYAIYTDPGAAKPPEKLAWIGSRCANPLGLYDMLGNASELTNDTFRFSLGNRLHGSSGGFVVKGGSFLKGKAEIMPGRREEMPFFLAEGAYRSRDMGMRLVISAIVTPEARGEALVKEYAALGSDPTKKTGETAKTSSMTTVMDQSKDPLTEIERLLKASQNETERKNLTHLRNVIKDTNITLEQKTAEGAKGTIRSALFTAESIANFAVRKKFLQAELDDLEQKAKQRKKTPQEEQFAAKVQRGIKVLEQSVNEALNFYMDRVKDSTNYPPELFENQMMRVSDELRGDDYVSKVLKTRLDAYRKHTSEYKARPGSLSKKAVGNEIIPEAAR